jgi:hypothetical protein
MSRYLRPRIAGATVFFTVTLADRGADTLTREVAVLRAAVHHRRVGGVAGPFPLRVDIARRGRGFFDADRRDQGAVYARYP